jgi:hypothetical protein
MSLFDEVKSRLKITAVPDKKGWYTALCPFHDDRNHPNLRFRETGFRCFACGEKGGIKKLALKLGIQPGERTKMEKQIKDTYDYKDEKGNLLYQVVRYEPKDFKQRRPDGNGGWIWNLNGVRRVLYRLPELVSSPKEEVVFIDEGEKDVKAVVTLGLIATCNSEGAGKFTAEMKDPLKDRNVVIIAHKDEPGRLHANKVAVLLNGFAASVKIIEMPGEKVKDAADWIAVGGKKENLLEMIKPTPVWKQPNLQELLDDISKFLKRFVVLTDEKADAGALWVVHTHTFEIAEATPYLSITSPEKRSGKTRLLEAFDLLVRRSWFTGRVTAAVLARKVDAECPTLLLDESDAAFKGDKEYSETLRALLNTGYRKGGKSSICVGQGASITYKDLSTFCPKAIAGIGKLPDTVADRSIPIVLKRRAPGEHVDRFRRRSVDKEAEPIRQRIMAWAADCHLPEGIDAVPDFLDDRAADCWEPLFVIADVAGGNWPEKARHAALILMNGQNRQDMSFGVRLLADIRRVYLENTDKLPSESLVHLLTALEDAPWSDLKGSPLNPRSLASILKPYEIYPHVIRVEGGTPRGYEKSDFLDAWERYLPPLGADSSATTATLASTQLQPLIRNTESGPEYDVADESHVRATLDVAVVADKNAKSTEQAKINENGQWELKL